MQLDSFRKIEADLKLEPGDPKGVQAYFTERCKDHMEKYVPMGDGDLRTNVVLNTESVIYISPYAHYMYMGKVMGPNIPIFQKGVAQPVGFYSPKGKQKYYTGANIHYHTPGTGDHWDQRMVSAEIDEVIKDVQDAIRSGKI